MKVERVFGVRAFVFLFFAVINLRAADLESEIKKEIEIITLKQCCFPVHAIEMSPSGKMLAVVHEYGKVMLWNLVNKTCVCELDFTMNVNALVFTPDNKFLVFGDSLGGVYLLDLNTNALVNLLRCDGPITSLAFSVDGKNLAIASGLDVGCVFLWNLESNNWTWRLECGNFLKAVRFSLNGKFLVVANHKNEVRVWDIDNKTLLRDFVCGENLQSLAFNSVGDALATAFGYLNGVVKVWDLFTGSCIHEFECGEYVHSFALNRIGKTLISGDMRGHLKLWNTQTKECLYEFNCRQSAGQDESVEALAIRYDCARFVAGLHNGSILIFTDKYAEGFINQAMSLALAMNSRAGAGSVACDLNADIVQWIYEWFEVVPWKSVLTE